MGDISVNINAAEDVPVNLKGASDIAVSLNPSSDIAINIPSDLLAPGPVFVSAEIGTVANNKLVITFDDNFNESIVPATSTFSTTGITGSPSIDSVGISGNEVTLTLSGDAESGDTITVSYTKPGSNPLQDADGKKSSSFSNESVSNNVSAFVAEYQTVYDSWIIKPTDAVAAVQNTMVENWISDGIWAKKDILYVFAAHTNDNGEASTNWINPGTNNAIIINAPVFVAFEGFNGDGATKYINTNYNPNTEGVNYTLDDGGFSIYSRTARGQHNSEWDYGIGIAPNYIGATFRRSTEEVAVYANSATPFGTIANSSTLGLFTLQRNSNTEIQAFRNKANLGTDTHNSTAIPNGDLAICCFVINGTPGNYSTIQYSMFAVHSKFTQTNVDDQTDAFETYMISNGKGVIP